MIIQQSKVIYSQDKDIDDLEEKEDQERIQKKRESMEEAFLQEEIDAQQSEPEVSETSVVTETRREERRTETTFTTLVTTTVVAQQEDEQQLLWEEKATSIMQEDELKLEEKEPVQEDIEADEAMTEEAFRSEQSSKSEDSFDGPEQDDDTKQERMYKEEVEMSQVESSYVEEDSEPQQSAPTDLNVAFSEEIEVERVPEVEEEPTTVDQHDEKSDEEEPLEDVYSEEVEIQKMDYDDNDVFEEEVEIKRVDENQPAIQYETKEKVSVEVYQEELEVDAENMEEEQQAEAVEEDSEEILLAEPLPDETDTDEEQEDIPQEESEIIRAEPIEEEEEAHVEEEEYRMEEEDQAIPQEIEGTEEQTDVNIYDNNNNQSMTRYYVDFSPGGSFERDSTASEEGEYPEVYRQGEPMEEDMEEFILVKYGEHSHSESSAEDDLSDHREMYVIPEEDSEDNNRVVPEEHQQQQEGNGETVFYEQGFMNPALEDIREEEEDEKEKHPTTEDDIEEKLQLEEYERLESFVILEEKLSQVESDEDLEEVTSGTDKKRSSSDETLNDDDELEETATTSSTLKDELTLKDPSGDESPGELDRTLTETEEVIDLDDGGVLSKRTTREETYSVEEDEGSDVEDDKDRTLTRKRVSKKVITTTVRSATHITKIPSEDKTGSDSEEETTLVQASPKEEIIIIDEPDEEAKPENTSSIETKEETIELEDGGIVSKLVTREETCTFEGDEDGDEDISLTKRTATRRIVTTTTTTTSRTTQLTSDEPLSLCSGEDDDSHRVEESSTSSEMHETVIKSRQTGEDPPYQTSARELSRNSSGSFTDACAEPLLKRRGLRQRFDSHDSEGHSSEGVSSTTDSTGESACVSGEDHISDEDYSGKITRIFHF